jgi:hypothetical protein
VLFVCCVVVLLPPGENPFAVNNNKKIINIIAKTVRDITTHISSFSDTLSLMIKAMLHPELIRK